MSDHLIIFSVRVRLWGCVLKISLQVRIADRMSGEIVPGALHPWRQG